MAPQKQGTDATKDKKSDIKRKKKRKKKRKDNSCSRLEKEL
jgi:hypothetical protein